MTRKKQINKAGVEFIQSRESANYFNTQGEKNTAHTGFIMGARWADAHPQNSWINASKQIPPEDKEGSNLSIDCLVIAGDGNSFFYVIAWYDYSGKCWYEKYDFNQTHLDGNKVFYWMELPKCNHIEVEGGEK